MPIEERPVPVQAVTRGPHAHFFGYYDKPPWDQTGRYMLALEAPAVDRMPLPGEEATIGRVDLGSGELQPLARTRAWNWQQGSMLQWLPPACDGQVIYNDAVDGRHVAMVLDVATGQKRALPLPVYNLARDGSFAVSISLARLAHTRSVVGYAGVEDPFRDDPHPAGDGIWRMDPNSGAHELIVSIERVARHQPKATMQGVKHRFEHVTVSPDGRRLFFMHRWPRQEPGRAYWDRLFTVNSDGSDLYLLADDDFVSHFDWRDGTHLLAWARQHGRGDHFYLFTDRTREARIIGGDVLTCDGHCTYSPNRRWILSDAYPNSQGFKTVLLYEPATGRRINVGHFATPLLLLKGDLRCDLHPRWSRDGRSVCIDSAHQGVRQMYVLDVSAIVTR